MSYGGVRELWHKDHVSGEDLPLKPIILGTRSVTEDISRYMQQQIKYISKKHASFMEDTQDFLWFLKDIWPLP